MELLQPSYDHEESYKLTYWIKQSGEKEKKNLSSQRTQDEGAKNNVLICPQFYS